jgi:hypothetical protein
MTLGDGTIIKTGSTSTSDKTVQLPENLYKIETILDKNESYIYQVKFYGTSGEVSIGKVNSSYGPGRVETFNFSTGEELIGCRLSHTSASYGGDDFTYNVIYFYLKGIEWIKWRRPA